MTATSGSGRLTTHILDTALGKPAAGLKIDLFRLAGAERVHLKAVVTNDDGRTDGPMLEGAEFTEGNYGLVFSAGDYIRRTGGEGEGVLGVPRRRVADPVGARVDGLHEPALGAEQA